MKLKTVVFGASMFGCGYCFRFFDNVLDKIACGMSMRDMCEKRLSEYIDLTSKTYEASCMRALRESPAKFILACAEKAGFDYGPSLKKLK